MIIWLSCMLNCTLMVSFIFATGLTRGLYFAESNKVWTRHSYLTCCDISPAIHKYKQLKYLWRSKSKHRQVAFIYGFLTLVKKIIILLFPQETWWHFYFIVNQISLLLIDILTRTDITCKMSYSYLDNIWYKIQWNMYIRNSNTEKKPPPHTQPRSRPSRGRWNCI